MGTIHCCIYKFAFHGNDGTAIDLKTYTEKSNNYNIEEVMEYLRTESNNGVKVIAKAFKEMTGKET